MKSILAVCLFAVFGAVLLLFAFVGVVSFNFVRLESAGARTAGSERNLEAWAQNGVRFLPRYRARGLLKRDGREIPYTLAVEEREAGLPLFSCAVDHCDEDGLRASGQGPTPASAMRRFFIQLRVTVQHHLSALRFFGFNRAPVRRAIALAHEKPVEVSRDPSSGSGSTVLDVSPGGGKENDRILWRGVHSFGSHCEDEVSADSPWLATFSGKLFRWNPGFRSQRKVILPDNRCVQVDCSVNAGADQAPTFSCIYAEERPAADTDERDEQLRGELSGPNPSTVVKPLLSRLGMSRYHQSGEYFFGLSVKAVQDQLQFVERQAPNRPPGQAEEVANAPPQGSGIWRQGYITARRSVSKPFLGLTPASQKRRMKLGLDLLKELLNGSVGHFVAHVLLKHKRFIRLAQALSSPATQRQLTEALPSFLDSLSATGRNVVLTVRDSAQLIVATSISQRSYNLLKRLLKVNNVFLKRYDTKISGMHTVLNNFICKKFCARKVFAKLRQRTTIKNRGKLLIKNYCHKREAVI